MMSSTVWKWLLLGVLLFFGCGGKEPPAEKTEKSEVTEKKPEIPPADPPKAPMVGQPNGAGYSSDSIRVQIGPDESLREQQSPKEGFEFLFVRLPINGSAQLVPKDYRIVIGKDQYTPHSIGFGRPNGVYSLVETFVGEQVELEPGKADQLLHDGERVQKCELKNPQVFLVYDVPQTANPTLWHGTMPFSLNPDFEALVENLSGEGGTLTANVGLNMADPNAVSKDYTAELLDSTRTRLLLNTQPLDVVILKLALSAEKPVTIELKKNDLALQGEGGSAGGRTIYFHFSTGVPPLTAGSSYFDTESYEGKKLIGLDSGSFRLDLSPAPVELTLIFPDPKFPGDLELRLSSSVIVPLGEPINPLGKFPPPIDKLPAMVAWAPLIGTPDDAGYLSDRAAIATNTRQLATTTPTNPQDGLKFLQVRFRVENEALFVPVDYRLVEPESNTIYRPLAVSFGEAPVFVKGLDYEKIPLNFGNETAPQHQGSKLTGWQLKTHEVTLLFEVAPSKEFVFLHGSTQFLIEL